MAKIHFKNGEVIQVPQQVLDMLYGSIIDTKEGAKKWQGFRNEHNVAIYLINLDEVCFLEAEKEPT